MLKVSRILVCSMFHGRGWLKPNGEWVDVPDLDDIHHRDIARDQGFSDDDDALRTGWVRVGLYSGSLAYIEFEKQPTNQQFQALWFYLINKKPTKISISGWGELTLDEFLTCNKASDLMSAVRGTKV